MSVKVENLNFIYGKKTAFEKKALDNINLFIDSGEFIGILGHTGSGKSTLIQHFNALIKPQCGSVVVYGIELNQKKVDYKAVRNAVGMVFQYPEHQLFDETVEKDISFGPKNLKLEKNEIAIRAKEAMMAVGLDYDTYKDRAPFELSGGEKRRVAIAGVLAMKPKLLILDEPTAGLDPNGKVEILNLIKSLMNTSLETVIVISHDIDEILEYADRLIVLENGQIRIDFKVANIYEHYMRLKDLSLDIPFAIRFAKELSDRGFDIDYKKVVRFDDLVEEIVRVVKKK